MGKNNEDIDKNSQIQTIHESATAPNYPSKNSLSQSILKITCIVSGPLIKDAARLILMRQRITIFAESVMFSWAQMLYIISSTFLSQTYPNNLNFNSMELI